MSKHPRSEAIFSRTTISGSPTASEKDFLQEQQSVFDRLEGLHIPHQESSTPDETPPSSPSVASSQYSDIVPETPPPHVASVHQQRVRTPSPPPRIMSQVPSQRVREVIPLTPAAVALTNHFPATGHKFIDEHIDTLATICTALESVTPENGETVRANTIAYIKKKAADLVLTAHQGRNHSKAAQVYQASIAQGLSEGAAQAAAANVTHTQSTRGFRESGSSRSRTRKSSRKAKK